MRRNVLCVMIAVFFAAFSGIAFAQFGGLAKLGGGSGSGSAVSAEDLVKKYVNGTKNVMKADVNMLTALGLKDQAAKEELAQKNLTEGSTSSSLEDAAKIQTDSSKALAEKMAEKKVTMDAESKQTFTLGLVDLAKGIKDYMAVGSDAKGYKPSPTSLGGAAGSAMFIVKSLPDSTSNLLFDPQTCRRVRQGEQDRNSC